MSTSATYLGSWELKDIQDTMENWDGSLSSLFSRRRLVVQVSRVVNGLTAFASLQGSKASSITVLISASSTWTFSPGVTLTYTNDHLVEKDRMAGDYTEEATLEYIGTWA